MHPPESASDSPERQLRRACADVERAARAGEPPNAEAWLERLPAIAADDDLAVELIFSEYLARESAGASPAPAAYYARFPKFRDRLERLFQVDELLKDSNAAGAASDFDSAAPSRLSHSVPPAPVGPPRGKRYGEYELLEKLGSGGMGVVYRAWQPSLRRVVAIKRLRGVLVDEPATVTRFRREAEMVAGLQHPHIVQIHDIGEEGGEPYLALEYVSGGSLRDSLPGKPLPHLLAAKLMSQVARAVHHAHERGIVHRDLKPANILLTEALHTPRLSATPFGSTRAHVPSPSTATMPPITLAEPKITDFGLAARTDGNTALTRSGQLLGTVCYMAPEQAAGKGDWVKPAVDLYALGAILYELLTGRPPFLAETELDTLQQVLTHDPISPRRLKANLPPDLETVCMKCLTREPSKRYATAAALADDLDRFLAGQPILARPAGQLERTMKWARRNPTGAATVVGSVVAGAAMVGLTALYLAKLQTALRNEQEQTRQANTARVKLEQKRKDTRATLDQLIGPLVDGWLDQRTALNAEQRAFAQRALAAYAELANEEAESDNESLRRAALASERVGDLLAVSGQAPAAPSAYREALGRYRQLIAAHPTAARLALDEARTLLRFGQLALTAGQWADADEAYTQAQAIGQRLADANATDVTAGRQFALALAGRGAVCVARGMPGAAEPYFERATAVAEQQLRAHGDRVDLRRTLAAVLDQHACALSALDRPAEAEDRRRRARELH